MKRLKQFLKWMYGYKFVYLISILLLIALQYLRTLSPLFITHIIDTILKGEENSKEIQLLKLELEKKDNEIFKLNNLIKKYENNNN